MNHGYWYRYRDTWSIKYTEYIHHTRKTLCHTSGLVFFQAKKFEMPKWGSTLDTATKRSSPRSLPTQLTSLALRFLSFFSAFSGFFSFLSFLSLSFFSLSAVPPPDLLVFTGCSGAEASPVPVLARLGLLRLLAVSTFVATASLTIFMSLTSHVPHCNSKMWATQIVCRHGVSIWSTTFWPHLSKVKYFILTWIWICYITFSKHVTSYTFVGLSVSLFVCLSLTRKKKIIQSAGHARNKKN